MMRHLLLFSCWVMSNSLWPLDCSPAGSSVHGILQARILEWVTTFSSRGSSPPRDQAHLSCLQLGSFPLAPSGKPMSNLRTCIIWLKLSQHDPSLMDSLWPWASCKDLVWGWETIKLLQLMNFLLLKQANECVYTLSLVFERFQNTAEWFFLPSCWVIAARCDGGQERENGCIGYRGDMQ